MQAFVWNLRTCSEMLRENAQAAEPRGRNTDALIRDGRLRSSVEAIVMIVERRGPAIDVWFGSTGNRKNSYAKRKAAAFPRLREPCKSRDLRTVVWPAKAGMFSGKEVSNPTGGRVKTP